MINTAQEPKEPERLFKLLQFCEAESLRIAKGRSLIVFPNPASSPTLPYPISDHIDADPATPCSFAIMALKAALLPRDVLLPPSQPTSFFLKLD